MIVTVPGFLYGLRFLPGISGTPSYFGLQFDILSSRYRPFLFDFATGTSGVVIFS